MKTDLNLNIAECLVHKTGLGSDYVYNICNGAVQVIPWAFGDWAQLVFIGIFITVLCLGLAFLG